MVRAVCSLLSAVLCSSSSSANSSCKTGLEEVELLRRAVDFLKTNAPASGKAKGPQTLKVSIETRTVYLDYGSGVQAVIFPASNNSPHEPNLQTLGTVPAPSDVGGDTWAFVEAAVAWIHADVSFDKEVWCVQLEVET